jgi:nicotinate-nucleotide adenylyltransferase
MGIKRPPCVLVLGGSFDPVHLGHVGLAKHFIDLLQPDELRLIPAGQPWQKGSLLANAEQRIAMLRLAFEPDIGSKVLIDRQEIERAERQVPSYSIDTLINLRAELGQEASIVFLIGADQLQNLSSWKRWPELFDFAHIVAASRPGFTLDETSIGMEVAKVWRDRAGTLAETRNTPAGTTYFEQNLAWDVSATHIRHELKRLSRSSLLTQTTSLMPPKVLDYIQQHHLYR